MASAPNLFIFVPLGPPALQSCSPPPPPAHALTAPPRGAPCTDPSRRGRVPSTPHSPPSPGQTPCSFHPSPPQPSPPLPPPRSLSSKSFHRPQLREEADARRRGCGSRGRRTRDRRRDPGARPDREPLSPPIPAPGTAPASAGAPWRLRPALPSLPPSLPRCAPPRRSSPSPPQASRFPLCLSLFRKGERWREATRLHGTGPPRRPAGKVLL